MKVKAIEVESEWNVKKWSLGVARLDFCLIVFFVDLKSANVQLLVWIGGLDSPRDPPMKGIVTQGHPWNSKPPT